MRKFWKKVGKVIAFPITAPVKLAKKGTERVAMGIVATLVRQALTMAGGSAFVATDDTVTQIVSAIGVIGSVIWSVWNARKQAKEEKS
jgi:hypothetical protein